MAETQAPEDEVRGGETGGGWGQLVLTRRRTPYRTAPTKESLAEGQTRRTIEAAAESRELLRSLQEVWDD